MSYLNQCETSTYNNVFGLRSIHFSSNPSFFFLHHTVVLHHAIEFHTQDGSFSVLTYKTILNVSQFHESCKNNIDQGLTLLAIHLMP